MMDRREISAFLIGCEPHQLMAFKDYDEEGAAAIGPDGKKYVFDSAYLEQAIATIAAAASPRIPQQAARRAQLPAKPVKRAAPPTRTGAGKMDKSAASKKS